MKRVRKAAAVLALAAVLASLGLSPTTAFASSLSLGSLSVTTWTANRAGFDGTIAVSGGTSPYTLTAQSGLPVGLTATLSGSTISIKGTPTAAGTFSSGSVTIKDDAGAIDSDAFGIVVNPALSFGPLSVTTWTVHTAGFDGTIAVAGGTGPDTLTAQSGLPAGLTAVLSGTTIFIKGTPTSAGTFSSGSLTVKDDTGATATDTFSIVIDPAPLSLGSLSVTTWTANRAGFDGTIAVSGGTSPYTLTAQSGLPVGLTATLSGSTISIKGTPTAAGTFSSGSVTIKDDAGAIDSDAFGIVVNPALSFGPLSVTTWTVHTAGFDGTIAVAGGTGPDTLTAQSGLPAGLTAVLSGTTIFIKGTPTSAGTFSSGSLTVKDDTGATATDTFSIVIDPAPLSLGSLSVTTWTANRAGFDGTIAVSGGTSPYTLTAQSGLPVGLTATLSGSTISIKGTPTAAGTFSSGSVTIKDDAGAIDSDAFGIVVNPALSFGPLSVTTWTVHTAGFDGTIAVAGGTGPDTLTAQSGLPAGLTAVLSGTTIFIKGTPTSAGTFSSGSLTVKDDTGATATDTFSIVIDPAPLSLGSLSVTTWTANRAGFDGTIAVSGGTSPYTLTAQSGLPVGLTATLSGSTISIKGTPTAAGTFSSGSVTIKDDAGAIDSDAFGIVVNPALSFGPLSVTTWTVHTAGFDGTIAVAGGTGPDTLTAQSGLPAGLTAVLSGTTIFIKGTPTSAGTFSSGSLTVKDDTGATATDTFSIVIDPAPLSLGSLSVTTWTANRAGFDGTIAVSGGTSPYTLTAQSGLPVGLTATLSGSTISIKGTPTAAGTFSSGSVTIKDDAGAIDSDAFGIVVNPALSFGPLSVTTWTVHTAGFDGTIAVAGGTGPDTLTAQSGLPAGLTAVLSGTTIFIKGTPTSAGTFSSGSLTVKDDTGATATDTFSVVIDSGPAVLTSNDPLMGDDDDFGDSVAISGDIMAVGAPGVTPPIAPTGSEHQGAVYVLQRPSGGSWSEAQVIAQLTASDDATGNSNARLGTSVAIDGTTIVAGAPATYVNGQEGQGAVYVFTEPTGGWASETEAAKLTASDGAQGDSLGSSVGVSGSAVVAGAPDAEVNGQLAQGAAYVFTEPTNGWVNETETAKLTASDGAEFDQLGLSVGISGENVVAGAPDASNSLGAVYVFTEGAGWATENESAVLTASDGDPSAFPELGVSVAIDGDTIVAGAPFADPGGVTGCGEAYVFTSTDGTFATGTESARLIAADGAAYDNLGSSVGVNGSTAVAGSPFASIDGTAQGAAYTFDTTTGDQTAKDSAPGDARSQNLGQSVAVSTDTVVAGAPGAAINGFQDAGAVFAFP